MEVKAIAKNIRISPRKVRLVADAIRNLSVDSALKVLEAAEKQAARPLVKALKSAVANAVNNAKQDRTNLAIASLQISQGQALKRFRPSTRGRIHPYKKRGSTITVVLREKVLTVKAISKAEEVKPSVAKALDGKGGKK